MRPPSNNTRAPPPTLNKSSAPMYTLMDNSGAINITTIYTECQYSIKSTIVGGRPKPLRLYPGG